MQIDQTLVANAEDYEIDIKFQADPPELKLGGATIPSITCGPSDVEWLFQLPEVTKSPSDTVEVSLAKGESADADMFALSEDAKELTLEADAIKKLTAGGEKKECPTVKEIKLEILIISQIMGEYKQILKVPVDVPQPEKEEEKEEKDTNSADSEAVSPIEIPRIQPRPKLDVPDSKDEKKFEGIEAPKKKIEKLKVSGLQVSPTSKVTINFSKPILPLPFKIKETAKVDN